MIYLLAFAMVALLITTALSVFVAGHLYGQQRMQNKWLVDTKRSERRTFRQLELWQTKAIERAGLGPLHRKETPLPDPKPSRTIIAPSQAIARQREVDEQRPLARQPQVPPSVATGFLKDAANGRKV